MRNYALIHLSTPSWLKPIYMSEQEFRNVFALYLDDRLQQNMPILDENDFAEAHDIRIVEFHS